MPLEQQLAHRVFRDPAYPYISNTTPLSTDPYFVSGSSDILTSIAQYAQRRPGFSDAVEPTPTTFTNLQRLFTWDRFDGTFFIMACDISGTGQAVVYKFQVGFDISFVSIFTEPSPTATPYDFVVSNNTVYFSNGFYVRKWDPINGLSNWGIASYVSNASASNYAGTGADGGAAGTTGTNAWTNPTRIQGAPDASYATSLSTKTGGVFTYTGSHYINATNYGFGVASTNFIIGAQATVTGHITVNSGGGTLYVYAQLLVGGNPVGSIKSLALTSTTDVNLVFGGPTDLWNTNTLTTSTVNASTFGIQLQFAPTNPIILAQAWNITVSLDSAQITVFSSAPPNVTFTGTGLTATTGYQYVICYGNSNTGHIGSPSLPSNLVKPANQSMSIPVVASTDSQVNQIHIFRTTDSATGLGGQSYFEIPNSPVANANASITDGATDLQLNIYSIAPTPTFNDPPPPMRGLVYFSGRIWGFTGNKVWFTGLEEITIGVPEECVPSGIAGNFWSFDQPVQGLGIAGSGNNQSLGVLCGGRLYVITGNTLDTFRRMSVSMRRGTRNLTTVSSMGGTCAWLDSSNQIWISDGSNMQELSIPIRPDIAGVTVTSCSMTFHAAGNFHWLVFSTGTKLFVYDMDTEQWMPPWTFAATYIFSGETSPGNYVLMASNGTKAIKLNSTKFNDNGATYQPVIQTNLMSTVPDFGKRFSYIGQGMYDEPSRTGVPWDVEIDTNNITLSDVLYEVDDDPTTATYTSIFANKQGADMVWNRSASAVNIVQQIFPTNQPSCRWFSLKIVLANADQLDKIYGWFLAYKNLGGK